MTAKSQGIVTSLDLLAMPLQPRIVSHHWWHILACCLPGFQFKKGVIAWGQLSTITGHYAVAYSSVAGATAPKQPTVHSPWNYQMSQVFLPVHFLTTHRSMHLIKCCSLVTTVAANSACLVSPSVYYPIFALANHLVWWPTNGNTTLALANTAAHR